MKLVINYCIIPGTHTPVCEDAALIGDRVICEGNGTIEVETPCCVALLDGVGGNGGGHEASVFVAEKLREVEFSVDEQYYRRVLEKINSELIAMGGQYAKRATTLTALFVSDEFAYLCYAGNTRLYAVRAGYLKQLTRDHSTYADLIAAGNEEAAQNCNRSEIRAAFGGGDPVFLKRLRVEKAFDERMPKRLLFTTDGVHDWMTVEEMEADLSVDRLTTQARENGSTDDCSAISVSVSG